MQQIDQRRRPNEPTAKTDVEPSAAPAGDRPSAYDDAPYTAEEISPDDLEPRSIRLPSGRRVLTIAGILLVVVLLVTLPPLINVNHFRRQIAHSVSLSLGRPVRIDSVALTMLPMPGFTLQNFVVGEDPAFGSEPVLRADSVRLTLRWSSLWRRRVEFSKITLDAPSVNLVHLPDGRWNLESILLQAARMPAAPTSQKGSGVTPRFPYIEATGARVNVKQGPEKLPLSLTDAQFSLWLPEPEQWRLRLEGHPTRTDAAPVFTGNLELEGTLGKAGSLEAVPVDLEGEWSAAPLGAVSQVLMGRDAGLRGEMTLSAAMHGRVGKNTLETRLRLVNLRRSEFVPDQTIRIDLRCTAQATALFHRLQSARCSWPAGEPANGLQLSADVPDVFRPTSAAGRVTLKQIPLSGLLTGLRVASPRVSPALTASGTLAADLSCCSDSTQGTAQPSGSLTLADARLALADNPPIIAGDLSAAFADTGELTFTSVPLALGGASPATLEVTASRAGLRMHLSGTVLESRLLALAAALPQFGDGLPAVLPSPPPEPSDALTRIDFQSFRAWGGAQVWTPVATTPPPVRKRRGRH